MQMRYEDTPKKVPMSTGTVRVIEFQPEWIEPQNGLPTHLHKWVSDNLEPDERVTGIRMIDGQGFPFHIQRDLGNALFENSGDFFFIAVFQSPSDDNTNKTIEVSPGQILYRLGNGTVIRRFVEVLHPNGPHAWRLDFEQRRVYERSDEYCPSILAYAFDFIDHMVFNHTGIKALRISNFIGMLGPGVGLRDTKARRLTPPPVVDVFTMLRDQIREWKEQEANPLLIGNAGWVKYPNDSQRYFILKEMTRRIMLKKPLDEPIDVPDYGPYVCRWSP